MLHLWEQVLSRRFTSFNSFTSFTSFLLSLSNGLPLLIDRRCWFTGGARDFLNIFSLFLLNVHKTLISYVVHTQRTGVRIEDTTSFLGAGGTGAGTGGGDLHAPMDEVQRHLHGRKKSRRGWEDKGREGLRKRLCEAV